MTRTNLDIKIKEKSGIPLYKQIKNQIRTAIFNEKLVGALPSVKTLAQKLNVSTITVQKAYEDLAKEGLLYSVTGKGYFINEEKIHDTSLKNAFLEAEIAEKIKAAKEIGISKDAISDMMDEMWNKI